eukprot:10865857-Alexandrium_andersonii.AAC.1
MAGWSGFATPGSGARPRVPTASAMLPLGSGGPPLPAGRPDAGDHEGLLLLLAARGLGGGSVSYTHLRAHETSAHL